MNTFVGIYFLVAITICFLGLAYKAIYFSYCVAAMGWTSTVRANNPLAPLLLKRSFWAGLWLSVVGPYRFWWKANPIMLVGHVLYHIGLFTAISVYVLVMIVGHDRIRDLPLLGEKVLFVCDWFSQKTSVFVTPWVDQFMHGLFFLALVFGVSGMLTPFVMSILKKRGVTRPVDEIMKGLHIETVSGLNSQQRGGTRRIVGAMVLLMDSAMLVSFLVPGISEYSCFIHVVFAMNILVLLPSSFLFHEVNRAGIFRAVYYHINYYMP